MSALGLLKVEDLHYEYGLTPRAVHRLTAARAIPFRRLPHTRRCLFEPAWLQAWQDGCELETVELDHGGLIVRPKGLT
jgi:hypothetical protein